MDSIIKFFALLVPVFMLIFGIAALMAFPTKWMVNYLFTAGALTAVFGVAKISVWQAFWLNWLCTGLFKSTTTSKK